MLRGRFILAFIPLGVPGSVARSLTLIWINSRSLLFQIFLLFLSISSNVYVVPFRVPPSPAFLHTLFYFCIALPILFFFLFSIGGLYWYILRDYLFNYVHSYNKLIKSEMKLLSRVLLFVTLWTVAYQALLSTWFSRQEDWSGLSFPSPGDLPDEGLNLCFLHWQADSLPLSHQGNPVFLTKIYRWRSRTNIKHPCVPPTPAPCRGQQP